MNNDLPDASVEDRLALIELNREQLKAYIRRRRTTSPPLTTRLTLPQDLRGDSATATKR